MNETPPYSISLKKIVMKRTEINIVWDKLKIKDNFQLDDQDEKSYLF